MRYLSLCSGIEAASVAWGPLGWQPAGFAEIDPYRCELLARYYPHVPNLGSLHDVTVEQIAALGPLDVVIAGTPCQDLSVAGLRAGIDGDRSHLFFDFMRIFHAARSLCGARWATWENVPGALSSNGGGDFARVVASMAGIRELRVPSDGWGNEGMALGEAGFLEWCVLDAQWFGLAQRRQRVFAVLDTGNWTDRPPVLLEPDRLRGDYPPRREAGARIAGTLTASSLDGSSACGGDGREGMMVAATINASGRQQIEQTYIPEVAATLTKGSHPGSNAPGRRKEDDVNIVAHVPEVSSPLKATSSRVRADCEATYVPEVAEPLTVSPGGGQYCNGGNNPKPRNLIADVSPAMTRKWAKGTGGPSGDECQNLVACFDESQITHPENRSLADPTIACTLTTDARPPTIAFKASHYTRGKDGAPSDICPPLTRDADRGDQDVLALDGVAVRRLTPTECERLQGFPDGYTAIRRADGKQASDTQRYAALGDSMPTTVIRWIGMRIDRARTIP